LKGDCPKLNFFCAFAPPPLALDYVERPSLYFFFSRFLRCAFGPVDQGFFRLRLFERCSSPPQKSRYLNKISAHPDETSVLSTALPCIVEAVLVFFLLRKPVVCLHFGQELSSPLAPIQVDLECTDLLLSLLPGLSSPQPEASPNLI